MSVVPRPSSRIPPEGWSVDSRRSLLSASSDLSVLSVGSQLSALSAGCLLSLGSAGSILSIGSAGSILSIGSVGSILGVGSRFRIPGLEGGRADGTGVDPAASARLVGLVVGALALVAAVTDR